MSVREFCGCAFWWIHTVIQSFKCVQPQTQKHACTCKKSDGFVFDVALANGFSFFTVRNTLNYFIFIIRIPSATRTLYAVGRETAVNCCTSVEPFHRQS